MPNPRTVGRPRGRRSKSLTVTLTESEYTRLQEEAYKRGLTLANFVREQLGAKLASYSLDREAPRPCAPYSSSSSVGTAATSSAPAAAKITGE